jgi:hypothetical protein
MSRTWEFESRAEARTPWAVVRATGTRSDLALEIDYSNIGGVQCYLDAEEARALRDWLSWYLGEGPEPETAG